jgi:hypothetical protein
MDLRAQVNASLQFWHMSLSYLGWWQRTPKVPSLTRELFRSWPQVRNYTMTINNTKKPPVVKEEDKSEGQHQRALQGLSNGGEVPYEATLRQVTHEGSRTPKLPPRQTQKHPVRAGRMGQCTSEHGWLSFV